MHASHDHLGNYRLVGLLADRALFSPWERFLHRRWGTGVKAA
jgi:NitT/TauT family transport system permease protein